MLSATREIQDGAPAVAALDVASDGEKPTASALRDAEADRIADFCSRLVGNFMVGYDDAPRRNGRADSATSLCWRPRERISGGLSRDYKIGAFQFQPRPARVFSVGRRSTISLL
jgi:hypothetical protein